MKRVGEPGVAVRAQGEFVADESDGGFTKGTQWLVWRFESDSTLADAVQVRLGPAASSGSTQPFIAHAVCCKDLL